MILISVAHTSEKRREKKQKSTWTCSAKSIEILRHVGGTA